MNRPKTGAGGWQRWRKTRTAKRPGFRSFRCGTPASCWRTILSACTTAIWVFTAGGIRYCAFGPGNIAPSHCWRTWRHRDSAALFAPYNTQHDVDALVNAVDRRWNCWWTTKTLFIPDTRSAQR
ncbi:hypothetical protein KCP77_06695 [Salmonella enterica subsp. enterica]|nr:hypothetical protein KCP77_06695 [Salmonella enterica subsp. enterica]